MKEPSSERELEERRQFILLLLVATCTLGGVFIFEHLEALFFPQLDSWPMHTLATFLGGCMMACAFMFAYTRYRRLRRRTEKALADCKRAREAPSEAEEKFKILFENSPELIVIVDHRGIVVSANDRMTEWQGYQPEEIMGKNLLDLPALPMETKKRLMDKFTRRMKGEKIEPYEVEMVTRSGERTVGQVVANLIYDRTGKPIYDLIMIANVTARKRAEEKLQAIIEQSPIPTIAVLLTGHMVSCNKAVEGLTGYQREEIANTSDWVSLLCLEEVCRKKIFEKLQKTKDGSDLATEQYTIARKDGAQRMVEAHFSFYGSGHIIQLVDQTERIRAEEGLRESREFLNKIIDSLADPIFVKDRKHRWVLVNEAECRFIGYPREKILGRTDTDYFPQEQVDVFWAKDEEVFRSGRENINEETLTTSSGEVKTIITKKSLYTDPSGAQYIVGITADITESKKAEAALRESEGRYRFLFEKSSAMMLLLDPEELWIVNANAAACNFYGYSREKLAMLKISDINTNAPDIIMGEMKKAVSGEKKTFLFQHRLASGEIREVEVYSSPIQFQGKTFLQSIIHDVTQRRQAEREIETLKKQMEFIMGATKTGLDILDSDYNVVYIDPEWQKVYGDYRGKKCYEYFMGAKSVCPGCGVDRAFKTKAVVTTEEVLVREGNRPIQVTTIPFQDTDGRWLVAEVNVDMSQRKHAEEARLQQKEAEARMAVAEAARKVLQAEVEERKRTAAAYRVSEAQYRTTIDSMTDVVHVVDRDLRVLLANRAFERVNKSLGFPEKIVGRNLFDICPFLAKTVRDEFRQVFDTGKPLLTEEITKIGGREFYTETLKIPIVEEGSVVRVVTVLRDVTERRRKEEENRKLENRVRHAQKLESLGVLAGGVAHDFNNLLMTILGNADIALLELPETAEVRQRIEDIKKASLGASELTKQMLAYSGKGRFLVQLIDVNNLVGEMGNLLQVSIPKNVELRYNFAHDLPPTEGDISQIRQIVMNLIVNASEAVGDRGGTITLTTGVVEAEQALPMDGSLHDDLPAGDYIYLEVSDTGCGMDEETKARIFDPFFSTKFIGRGLGLAAVLGIVRGHRGGIQVWSEKGKGTTFRVLLPCSDQHVELEPEAAAEAVVEAKPTIPLRATGTVLVIEDEEGVQKITKMMLERAGFGVLTASDGRAGLDLFKQRMKEIGLVVLDLSMPYLSGKEVFREMIKLDPEVRVILSSGYTEEHVKMQFEGVKPAGFIQKPYLSSNLIEKVRANMRG